MEEPAASSAVAALALSPAGLIGRATEMGALEALLTHPDVRLVTLTGPGGMGKTRLAEAVADRLAPSFPGGVFRALLSPVREPSLVISVVASVLGVEQSHGGQAMVEAVARERARDRPTGSAPIAVPASSAAARAISSRPAVTTNASWLSAASSTTRR